MQVHGNFTATQTNIAEGQATITHDNRVITITTQQQKHIDDQIQQKDEAIQHQLHAKIQELESLLKKEQEPSKIQALLRSMYAIAPDVAKTVVNVYKNPLSLIGIVTDYIIEDKTDQKSAVFEV